MRSYKDRLSSASRQIAQSWLTWLTVGAAGGAAVLLLPGMRASDADPRTPSGLEIETAVAQAEGEANAAREASAVNKED